MAAAVASALYKPNVPISTKEGLWIAIAPGPDEAVRVLLGHPTKSQPHPPCSMWWSGSASPSVVQNWVAQTIELLNPSSWQCRVKVWADKAPKESKPYRIDDARRIADDIQEWANDGAIGCYIIDAPQNLERAYMWAELRPSDDQPHSGEVGLNYASNELDTYIGKRIFSTLLHDTSDRRFSWEEIETVYNMMKESLRREMPYAFGP